MADFYRHWFDPREYATPSGAPRGTQLEWIKRNDPSHHDPNYWAPYVLVEHE
jgi:CHAT domain-containing protein